MPIDFIRAELDDDDQVRQLKRRLDGLQRERARKDVALSERNVAMAERDAERERIFRATYLTPEALARLELERLVQALQARLEVLVVTEDEHRGLGEEEEAQEFKLLMCDHHMSLIALSVGLVSAEAARREHRQQCEVEARARVEVMYQSLKEGLLNEALAGARQLQRTEATEFKAVGSAAAASRVMAERATQVRVEREYAALLAAADEAEAARQRALDAEVEELERAADAIASRITSSYCAQRQRPELESGGGGPAALAGNHREDCCPLRSPERARVAAAAIIEATWREVVLEDTLAEEDGETDELEAANSGWF